METAPLLDERSARRVFAAVVLGILLVSLGVAYLDEDAFISFRVVDNFVHGYGLRWNVDERVQVYTNPLWVLALIPLHAVFSNIAWASWTLSAAASTAAIAWIAWQVRREPTVMMGAFVTPLLLSQSFTDYTNSGLENPLLYLFIALFAERVMREEAEVPWFALCVIAALAALTRLDSFLLFAPTLGWLWLRDVRRARYGAIVLGALPLLLWLGFALLYYGTVFPNPKYAKLNGGIPLARYIWLGGTYLLDTLRNDTVTFVGLLSGLGLALHHRPRVAIRLLLVGASLYCVYVVYVGGDFMAGRHFASPFFLTVCTLALAARGRAWTPNVLLVTLGVLLATRFVVQPLAEQKGVVQSREQNRYAIVRNGGIRLQRFNCGYYEALVGSRGPLAEHSWSNAGLVDRLEAEHFHAEHSELPYVVVDGNIGKIGYFGGPGVTYVDRLGIADAMMARLPDTDGKLEMSGHLWRDVPMDYLNARRTGSFEGIDPDFRAYYEPLRLILSGPLLAPERLTAIWKMNTGAYDASLRAYVARLDEVEVWVDPKK
jgi:arabinofuranosyltransferase